MKILHTSDLHLSRRYKGDLPSGIAIIRREELWKSFENTIKYANENKVDVLLICGDLYEKDYFTSSDMIRFKNILEKLNDIEVFIICGNHDYLSEDSIFNRVEFNQKIHIFKKEEYFEIESLNLRVYGKSWDSQFNYTTNLNYNLDEKYLNILMLHGMVNDKNYFGIDTNYIDESKFDYIALGHIHKRQKISHRCYYSGSPEPLSFKDKGPCGFIIIDIDKNEIEIKEIDNSIREYNYYDLEINTNMTLENILDKVKNLLIGLEKNFNVIKLKGEYSSPEYLIEYLYASTNYFYIKFVDNLKTNYDLDILLDLNKDNIMGIFIKEMQNDKLALDYGLRALLEAEDDN